VQSFYTLIALDIASQRSHEAERRHQYDVDRANEPESGRSIRRGLASIVAAVSRGSGQLARSLDENVNVIGRSVAACDGTCVESRS
jgi:hypothetical protein